MRMDLGWPLFAVIAMSFVGSQAGGAQMIEQNPPDRRATPSPLIPPGPSVLRSVFTPPMPSETSQSREGLNSAALQVSSANGEKGAIFGALILGTAAAVVGSQLCEKGEDCTGTAIGFGLMGATVGAVVGAFIGSAAEDEETEEDESPAPELPAFEPETKR